MSWCLFIPYCAKPSWRMPWCCLMLFPRLDRYTLRPGVSAPFSAARTFGDILQALSDVGGVDMVVVSWEEAACAVGASGGGWDNDDKTEGAAAAISEADRWARGETHGSVGVVTVDGAACPTAASAPVSMLNRRSSCWRSCSALLSSRCSRRSSAWNSLSSRASSRERSRSSADCCQLRKLARALSRLPWPPHLAPPLFHDDFPPRRRFLCLAEVEGWEPSLRGGSGVSSGPGPPTTWPAAVAEPAMFKSLRSKRNGGERSYFTTYCLINSTLFPSLLLWTAVVFFLFTCFICFLLSLYCTASTWVHILFSECEGMFKTTINDLWTFEQPMTGYCKV